MELLASQTTDPEPVMQAPATVPTAAAATVAPPTPAKQPRVTSEPSPVVRYLLVALAAAVIGGSAAGGVLFLAGRPDPGAGIQVPASVQAVIKSGSLSVAVPGWLPDGYLRMTLVREGQPASTVDGGPVDSVPAELLGEKKLEPALYHVRFIYRENHIEERAVEVRSGVHAELTPNLAEMAKVEYQLGLQADAAHAGGGITYFRRSVKLDAKNVPAHLQLAAVELLRGSVPAVRDHLKAVRAVDPGNADAAAVEKLLASREGK
jgi:hypothetical protein